MVPKAQVAWKAVQAPIAAMPAGRDRSNPGGLPMRRRL
jgi:hypothetical protein